MPSFTPLRRSRLHGSTAVLALSVVLSLPVTAVAQQATTMPPPAPVVVPDTQAAPVGEEWASVERLGFRFEMPSDIPVEEDSAGYYAVSSFDAERTQGMYLSAQRLDAEQFAGLPEAGSEAMLAFLGQMTRVTMAATGEERQIGRFTLVEYRGSAVDAEGIERNAVVYISQELNEGEAMMVGVVSAGIGGAVVGTIEARFLNSFTVVEPDTSAEPDTPDDDGAQDEAEGVVIAEAQGGVTIAEPMVDGVRLAEAEPNDGETTADAPAATEEAPAETADAVTEAAPTQTELMLDRVLAAVEAMPDPSGTVPEGWTSIERFGLRIAAPPGLELTRDVTTPVRDMALRGTPDGSEGEAGVAMSVFPAERLPAAPTDPAFTEALLGGESGLSAVSARRVILGDRMLLTFVTVDATDEGEANRIGVYLVDLEANDADEIRLMGFRAEGVPEEDALQMAAGVLASLAVATPAEEAPADTPEETPVAEVEVLPDGQVTLRPADGATVVDLVRRRNSTELFLADADGTRHTLVAAGDLRRGVEQQLRRMLNGLDALVETELDGQPVWVIYGPSTRDFDQNEIGAEAGYPLRVFVPQGCVDGEPPYMAAIMAQPGDEARLDAAQAALSLSLPAGAEACPPELMDRVRAALPDSEPQATTLPETPSEEAYEPAPFVLGEVPADWERMTRFGLDFAVPPGMTLRRERTGRSEMELWFQSPDRQADVSTEIMMRIFTPASMAGMPRQSPDDEGFAEMLSGFASMPITDSGETVTLGDLRLRLLRGAEVIGGERVQVLYAVAEAPAGDNLMPWLAVKTEGQSPEAAEAIQRAFLSSLGGTPAVEEAATTPGAEIPMPPPSQLPPQGSLDDKPEPQASAPVAPTPPAADSSVAMSEARAWEAARQSNTAEAMLAYLAQYPRGLHSGDARGWLHARDIYAPDEVRPDPVSPPPVVAPVGPQRPSDFEAWDMARADGRAEGIWTYLKMYPEGGFAYFAQTLLARHLAGETPTPFTEAPAAPMPGRPDPRPMK
ncbi:hypothetical protein [Pararhodobacter sp. CCB-MM2]|uniref:hypothetical protein n=1 Tax=Pararhodobacter sp. CCB-MM2 TaxID=1786003 RepID=UPI0008368C35|nr:hypothetical protein [Pararhodobacter sp. CCB-MM2]